MSDWKRGYRGAWIQLRGVTGWWLIGLAMRVLHVEDPTFEIIARAVIAAAPLASQPRIVDTDRTTS